ncbi:hypothetical protein [Sphingosinicella sp.]|uniref:hypothetical protein n=1 Tax=Sphingosinicella sp. TaxID=1917971 RepID=UPI004037CC38
MVSKDRHDKEISIGRAYPGAMGSWTFAWDPPEEDAPLVRLGRAAAGLALVLGVAFAVALFAYGTGLVSTYGWAEGSERHNSHLTRTADNSEFGLHTVYVFAGQRLWWDYDVAVEGSGGVRLWISKTVPRPDFIARAQDVETTGRGRFEVVAPESGFYAFRQEYVPYGVLLDGSRPGATRYRLNWGVD